MVTKHTKTPCEQCGSYVSIKNRRQYGREGIRVCPDCYKKLQGQMEEQYEDDYNLEGAMD